MANTKLLEREIHNLAEAEGAANRPSISRSAGKTLHRELDAVIAAATAAVSAQRDASSCAACCPAPARSARLRPRLR